MSIDGHSTPSQIPPEGSAGSGSSGAEPAKRGIGELFLPPVSAWVFISILLWLFIGHFGAATLLSDGDTGWHIRTGEYVLDNYAVPRYDLFSFSMEGKEWFAWEWLADVVLALCHRAAGLNGVVLLTGVVVAMTAVLAFEYMLWLRVNILVAITVMTFSSSASMIHWLARPHMFTWGFLIVTAWLLEADRRKPGRKVYFLVPLVVIWTNVHGGFVALLAAIVVYAVGVALARAWAAHADGTGWGGAELWKPTKRYALLLALCAAATLVNPYGYELHLHIGEYLGNDFILNNVQEFQSPKFRGESMHVFEAFLFATLFLVVRMALRRELAPALLLLMWAHASLVSARHIPLFMLLAAPWVGRELTLLVDQAARSGNKWLTGLKSMAEDYGGTGSDRSPWNFGMVLLPLIGVGIVGGMMHLRPDDFRWKAQFPELRFPVAACDALGDRLTREPRVLSSDQWSDYLIYRFHPNRKVFFDGRSDFYAPELRDDYLQLIGSGWRWREIVDRHEFDAALLPLNWSLASAMKVHPDWNLIYDDGFAVYFERVPN